MAEGACNYRFGGPAMKPHWIRTKWNLIHILDFKNTNPHNKQEERKAYRDLFPSLIDVFVGYAKLCPTKAGKVQLGIAVAFLGSLVTNVVLLCLHWV